MRIGAFMYILSLDDLPNLEMTEKRCRALALLDTVLMPDWEHRYFSFNSNWNVDKRERMASMRNGQGDHYYINFTDEYAIGKVFSDNVIRALGDIPVKFTGFITEPAFEIEEHSYIFWNDGRNWYSPQKLDKFPLLNFITDSPQYYYNWAVQYYGEVLDISIIKKTFTFPSVSNLGFTENEKNRFLDRAYDDVVEILGDTNFT